MNDIIEKVREELRKNSSDETKESGQRFFKEDVKLYGVKTAIVSKIGKRFFRTIKDKKKTEVFELCELFLQSGYLEESFIACHWSYFVRKNYEPEDFKTFERWVSRYVNNWASCDTLSNHTIGAFIDKYPDFLPELKRWAKSENRWMRRAAAVSLIIPARQGKFLNEIFDIADILLTDKDDLVQKGYGWMLKSASRKHQKEVYNYVMEKKAVMPRTALRYAIEKMPEKQRALAME